MTRPLVVIGAGGFGREVLELVDDVNAATTSPAWEVVGVLDDGEVDAALLSRLGTTHLGPVSVLPTLDAEVRHVIAVGGCSARAAIDARCVGWGRTAATLVHPSAVVGRRSVEVGEGSVLCAYASATTNIRLGRHVHLNPHASVGHDSVLGDHTTVTPQAGIAGAVTLGARVFVGTGAIVGPGLTVGDDVLVGAGAVVVRDVEPGATVAGVPARRH
ncbi:NeuD/PglB/VioB family sugar acetyltransferase [Nocardioides aequoreus]|uniref:NeuD/PglB/VioB family sugar acetyltransferase n=1 Tax=Nocardioides aequoreus TaxID=397278 RepID=UPI0004C462F3|nr:NeuD/PglB/VioB family sugar acetyltransferase [Nocardioides aequoreus]